MGGRRCAASRVHDSQNATRKERALTCASEFAGYSHVPRSSRDAVFCAASQGHDSRARISHLLNRASGSVTGACPSPDARTHGLCRSAEAGRRDGCRLCKRPLQLACGPACCCLHAGSAAGSMVRWCPGAKAVGQSLLTSLCAMSAWGA